MRVDAQSDIQVVADNTGVPEWRVEYFDRDGGCYVTIFAGPRAERRARQYYDALKWGALKTITADP